MKDPADNVTTSLIPEAKKRGRPSSGNAMTPAQRKRKSRAESSHKPVEELTERQLIEMISLGKEYKNAPLAAWKELGKRRGWITELNTLNV